MSVYIVLSYHCSISKLLYPLLLCSIYYSYLLVVLRLQLSLQPTRTHALHYTYKKCAMRVARTSVQESWTKPPLQSIPVNGPFHCIGRIIYKEMNLSRHGNCYALVFQMKWSEVYVALDCKATIATYLADFIWRHGVPIQILHDQAVECFYKKLSQILGVTQLPTSGGHPQMDEMVEGPN